MKKIIVFKLKNGINIECEEELIKVEEVLLASGLRGGWITGAKRYYVRNNNFCLEFLQEEIESVSYKIEDKEEREDVIWINEF